MINHEFGALITTPWTVGKIPDDDILEILYWIDARDKLLSVEQEARERNRGPK